MPERPLICAKDLTIGFNERTIQKNLNFEIYPGEIFAILGGSGSGKSTLMRHLIGLHPPLSGEIFIGDISLNEAHAGRQDFQNILRKIGVAFQGSAMFTSMTLAENIALAVEEHLDLSEEDIASLVCIKLGLVNLNGYEEYFPSELSGGMRKRAAIARAIALNPDILFLDEPSAGLDPILSADIDELLTRINRFLGTTMVIVSHSLSSVFNIAHRLILLDAQGEGILVQGAPKDFFRSELPPYARKFLNSLQTKPSQGNLR